MDENLRKSEYNSLTLYVFMCKSLVLIEFNIILISDYYTVKPV